MSRKNAIRSPLTCLALVCAAITLQAGAQAQALVNVDGIQPGQVFQRVGTAVSSPATVYLRPSNAPANTTNYSITLLNSADQVISTLVTSQPYTTGKRLQFSVATGRNTRKVRVSFSNGTAEIGYWKSPAFSVGEVFLVAGQSNAASHGYIRDAYGNIVKTPVDPYNKMANAQTKQWDVLQEPLSYATSETDLNRQGSPWVTFAATLGAKLQVPVAVVDVAYGGSPTEWWLPNGKDPRDNTPVAARLALGAAAVSMQISDSETDPTKKFYCSFRAVLWHQGEANSEKNYFVPSQPFNDMRTGYVSDMKTITQAFRSNTGCTQPWMVARATYEADFWWTNDGFPTDKKFAKEAQIRTAQNYLSARSPLPQEPAIYAGPDTDMMISNPPSYGNASAKYRYDGVHLNRRALDIHGKLWADRVARSMFGLTPAAAEPTYNNPENLVPEVRAVWDLYASVLGRTPDDMLLDAESLRYWVSYVNAQELQSDAEVQNFANTVIKPMFQSSLEYKVRNVFVAKVNRQPSMAEMNFWVGEINAGRETETSVGAKIAVENTPASLSYYQNRAWLLYVRVMNRITPEISSDMGGVNYWAGVLQGGQPESAVSAAMKSSDEYLVRSAYMKAKRRQPTWPELSGYMSRLSNGSLARNETVVADELWAIDPN